MSTENPELYEKFRDAVLRLKKTFGEVERLILLKRERERKS